MKIIKLDATGWKKPADFYDALLPLLGAPDWHGRNLNALTESMVWGNINSLKPPYTIQVSSTNELPPAVLEQVKGAETYIPETRADFRDRKGRDVQVYFEIVS